MKPYLHLSLLALLGLGLVACDSNDDDDNRDSDAIRVGASEVKIEGDANLEFDGYAFFTIVEDDEGEPNFALFLADEPNAQDDVENLVLFTRAGTRPGTGTYAIDGAAMTAFLFATLGETELIAGAGEGELRLSASSGSRVEGTFAFTALAIGATEEITVSGPFKAPFVENADDLIDE